MSSLFKKTVNKTRVVLGKVSLFRALYTALTTNILTRLFSRLFHGEADRVPYLISKEKKLVCTMIPKVATSSLRKIMCSGIDKKDFIYKIDLEKKNWYVFTVVRNPFSKVVSAYEYYNKFPPRIYNLDWINRRLRKAKMSFDEFVSIASKRPDSMIDRHLKSQHSIIFKQYNLIQPQKVLRMESLDKDFEIIRKKYKLPKLSHLNTTKKKDWRDYYTQETAKKVYARYKKDCDVWYPSAFEELKKYLKKKKKKTPRKK